MIKDEGLRAYADLLEREGFAIYEPSGHDWPATYFTYSRVVDGKECFGTVQQEYFGGYSHTMPIKPSQENGSHMFVEGVPNELTVEAARAVARPANFNKLVGTQRNYRDPYWLERSYVRRQAVQP